MVFQKSDLLIAMSAVERKSLTFRWEEWVEEEISRNY